MRELSAVSSRNATPVPQSQFYAHEAGATLDQLRGLAREYAALAAYWWRGWI